MNPVKVYKAQRKTIVKMNRLCRVSCWRRSKKLSRVAAWPPSRTGYISVFVL